MTRTAQIHRLMAARRREGEHAHVTVCDDAPRADDAGDGNAVVVVEAFISGNGSPNCPPEQRRQRFIVRQRFDNTTQVQVPAGGGAVDFREAKGVATAVAIDRLLDLVTRESSS